jgi:DNA invertase Pin-like site-specific DNA recombinase
MSGSALRRAISYTRMSTELQLKGSSLTRQLEQSEKYAAANNLELIENLQDIGLSGFSGKHIQKGALGQLLSDLKDGAIDKNIVLLVESLDRLSRQSPLDAFTQFSEILTYGIEIHTIFDRQVYTKDSVSQNPAQLFMSIGTMLRAYDESKSKSERLKSAWAIKRKTHSKGMPLTRRAPGWIDVVEKPSKSTFVFNLNIEAKAIEKIFELTTISDLGSFAITRYLNEHIKEYPRGPNSKSKSWGHSYVKKIMDSSATYGRNELGKMVDGKRVDAGEYIDDYYPAVISKSTFLLAERKIKQRQLKGGRHGTIFPNLFQGLICCGYCGSNLKYLNKGTNSKNSLRCTSSLEGRGCRSPAWNYEEFETTFLQLMNEIPLEEAFKKPEKRKKNIRRIEGDIAGLEKELREATEQYENLKIKLLEISTDLVGEFETTLREFKLKKENLEQKIISKNSDLTSLLDTSSQPKIVHAGLLSAIRALPSLAGTDNEEKAKQIRNSINALLKKFIATISIYNREEDEPWELEYTDPELISLFAENVTNRSKFKRIEDFYASESGKRILNRRSRYFTVKFKEGKVAYVRPFKTLRFDFKKFKNGPDRQ